MKNKITLLFFSLVLLILIPLRPKAQSSICNCWPTHDTSWHHVPFNFASPPLYQNDDDYTGFITLPFSFCFFGTSVSQITISNNGFITWGTTSADLSPQTYEPITFPNSVGPIIAPFWADVYTPPGLVWYSITSTHIIVQWDSVGGFGLGNSGYDQFEVILTNGSDPIIQGGNGDDIEFCYGQMGWCVGTASGGSGNGFGGNSSDPAVVGINEGNGTGNLQWGLFNTSTSTYNGQYPPNPYDGLFWLSNQTFVMNGCTAVAGNVPPALRGLTGCTDTFRICEGDTVKVPLDFTSYISGAIVNSGLFPPPIPSGTSIVYNVSTGQRDTLVIQVVGNSNNIGYNTVNFIGYDNLNPSDTTFGHFVVEVSPSPNVSISAVPDTICLGSTTTLTAGGGLSYMWSTGSTDSTFTITPTVTTTYSVVIATAGCNKDTSIKVTVDPAINLTVSPTSPGACASGSVTLTASGANTYTWVPNTGLSCYTCASPVATPTATTVYTITGTANGCSSVITDTVKVFTVPVITVSSSPDSICTGDSVQLTASSTIAGTTYIWSPTTGLSCTTCSNPYAKPTGTTVYTATGTDADGCSAFASVSVFVSPLPALSVSPNMSICPGKTVTLYASGNGITYTWSPGGETGPSLTVTPAYTQTYTVTMTSGCGSVSASVTVTVNPQPIPSFYSNINAGCVPLCTQFHNTSTIASGFIATTSWSFGTGDTSNANNPIYCFQNAGAYSIILTTTSDSGCSSTLSVNDLINVYNHPNPAFTASPQPTTMLQPTVNFTNNSTDAYGIIGWNWTFGDATDSTAYSQNAIHTYQDTGTYCATLTVTNLHGCTDSVTNCIVISPDYCLYIPDAFSPNGDGVNDVFKVVGNDVKSFEMYIFDRWGLQLFHTTDISTGWNGTKAGGICQEDAYVYLINVYDTKDKKHAYMGTLQLIK